MKQHSRKRCTNRTLARDKAGLVPGERARAQPIETSRARAIGGESDATNLPELTIGDVAHRRVHGSQRFQGKICTLDLPRHKDNDFFRSEGMAGAIPRVRQQMQAPVHRGRPGARRPEKQCTVERKFPLEQALESEIGEGGGVQARVLRHSYREQALYKSRGVINRE